MSIICGLPVLECVYCLACVRWVWKKCLYTAGSESEHWGHAAAEEFHHVPHMCRVVLAVYEDDLRNPLWAPPGGYRMNPDWVISRKNYEGTKGQAPPYIIYLDHDNKDIIVAVRGLNLAKESDYAVLLDDKLGQTTFDGGFVHNGLLKSARWVFDTEGEFLRDLLEKNHNYTLTFSGHSLGSGVVTLLTILAVHNRHMLGNIDRKRIRCYAFAPTRCVSLNLAVRYADVINSIVLQDDFLPRTATSLENVFKSLLCLPCLMCVMCLKDTCTMDYKRLKDPGRLYAPGRLFHIVNRRPFRIGRIPPVVRTAVPVDGRFDHIVLSCNATSDHAIVCIERESQRALDLMMETPREQRMERQQEHERQYREALKETAALSYSLSSSHHPSPPTLTTTLLPNNNPYLDEPC